MENAPALNLILKLLKHAKGHAKLLRDHNENKAFKALFCVIPAITSQLVFNFLTDLFLLDIVIICSTDSVTFYLWRNIPTYLPTHEGKRINQLRSVKIKGLKKDLKIIY